MTRRRVGAIVATVLTVVLAVYLLPGLLPGGTVTGLLGPHALDPAARAVLADELHTGWPLPIRAAVWVLHAATGDLGASSVDGADVGAALARALLRTVPVVLLGVLAVVLLARRRRFPIDSTTAGLLALGILGAERLAGGRGLGRLLSDAVARRDLVVLWGAVLAVAAGAALVTAVGGVPPTLERSRRSSPAHPPPGRSWVAGCWLVLFPAAAAFAPRLPLDDPHHVDLARTGAWFSAGHPLGTDDLGRDVLARVVFGARVSLGLAVAALVLAFAVGAAAGAATELATVRLHGVTATWARMMAAFPGPVAALALVAFGGRGARPMVTWLAASVVVPVARFARSVIRRVARERRQTGDVAPVLVRRLSFDAAALAARLLAVVVLVEAGLGVLRLAPDARLGWSVDLAGDAIRTRPATPGLAATLAAVAATVASLLLLARLATLARSTARTPA